MQLVLSKFALDQPAAVLFEIVCNIEHNLRKKKKKRIPMRCLRFSPCHSSSCFLALRGEVLVGAVWARPLFPPTASLLPSSSSLTGLYLSWNKIQQFVSVCFDERLRQLLQQKLPPVNYLLLWRHLTPNSARHIRLRRFQDENEIY